MPQSPGIEPLALPSKHKAWVRLFLAGCLALGTHLAAGLGMLAILRHGLDTNTNLLERMEFIVNRKYLWISAWLAWNVAALSILFFYYSMAIAHEQDAGCRLTLLHLAVIFSTAAIAVDLTAETLEMGLLPDLAALALNDAHAQPGGITATEMFLLLHRIVVMLSGYLANGLYSLSALMLAWTTRKFYPVWTWMAGISVGAAGFALSAAALANSAQGMFWTNVVLVPGILVWLAGVAAYARKRASVLLNSGNPHEINRQFQSRARQ